MQMPLLPAAVAVAALLAACTTYRPIRHMSAASRSRPTRWPAPTARPAAAWATDAHGDAWITQPGEIEGFTYEPGFAYELLVEAPSEVARSRPRDVAPRVDPGPEQASERRAGPGSGRGSGRPPLGADASSRAATARPNGPQAGSPRSSTSGAAASPAVPAATTTPQRWRYPATRCRCPRRRDPKSLPVEDRDGARAGVPEADRPRAPSPSRATGSSCRCRTAAAWRFKPRNAEPGLSRRRSRATCPRRSRPRRRRARAAS